MRYLAIVLMIALYTLRFPVFAASSDLAVIDIWLEKASAPGVPVTGTDLAPNESFIIVASITNLGQETANGYYLDVYYDSDYGRGGPDNITPGEVQEWYVGPLTALGGQHTTNWVVNPDLQIAELDEQNNQKQYIFNIGQLITNSTTTVSSTSLVSTETTSTNTTTTATTTTASSTTSSTATITSWSSTNQTLPTTTTTTTSSTSNSSSSTVSQTQSSTQSHTTQITNSTTTSYTSTTNTVPSSTQSTTGTTSSSTTPTTTATTSSSTAQTSSSTTSSSTTTSSTITTTITTLTTITTSSSMSSVPSLVVTSPKAGQSWQAGSKHSITWTFKRGTSPVLPTMSYTVDIWYNEGGGWISIVSGMLNMGTYSWKVPAVASPSVQVRIDLRSRSGIVATGFSGYFTITGKSVSTTARTDEFYLLPMQDASPWWISMFLLLTGAWLGLRLPRYWTGGLVTPSQLRALSRETSRR